MELINKSNSAYFKGGNIECSGEAPYLNSSTGGEREKRCHLNCI